MSQYGEQLDLPLQGDGQATCPVTGTRYILQSGQIVPVEN
jgi:UDP-2-acetamido-3-amino-2,3-dideoxy-glucuronate N-acetyltransferase